MKIAVWHNLPSGGGKRALFDHVRGLTGRGHTVEVWCPPTSDPKYLPLGSMAVEHILPMDWPVTPHLMDLSRTVPSVRRRLDAMDAHCRLCAQEIDSGGFDVLFANSCYFFGTTSIGRFVKSVPSVLYLQEPCRYLYEAAPRLKWVAPPPRNGSVFSLSNLRSALIDWRDTRNFRLQAREEADNAECFTRILVNSFFSRESILRAYGLPSDVCYLGINSDLFADRHLPREDYVVGLGSITPSKNIGLVIASVAQVPVPRPRLVWVGNTVNQDYLAEMTAMASSLQVDFTTFVNVSDDQLIDILNRAGTMVYTPNLEPFGLAPLEASACGVPVVAVAEGGVRETIIDNVSGLQVEPIPSSIASAISRLHSDPVLARRLGTAGQIGVKEKWSLQAATDRIEKQLDKYAIKR